MKSIFTLLVMGLTLTACSDEGVKSFKLNHNERLLIDSLYKVQVDTLKKDYDSICIEMKDDLRQHLVDSIIRQRIQDEEKLRKRIENQNIENDDQ